MVTTDDEGENGSLCLTGVVPTIRPFAINDCMPWCARGRLAHLLGKAAELAVLVRNGHALEVAEVAYCLEVTADEEEVDGVAALVLERGYLGVYGVELAMAATFDGNLKRG